MRGSVPHRRLPLEVQLAFLDSLLHLSSLDGGFIEPALALVIEHLVALDVDVTDKDLEKMAEADNDDDGDDDDDEDEDEDDEDDTTDADTSLASGASPQRSLSQNGADDAFFAMDDDYGTSPAKLAAQQSKLAEEDEDDDGSENGSEASEDDRPTQADKLDALMTRTFTFLEPHLRTPVRRGSASSHDHAPGSSQRSTGLNHAFFLCLFAPAGPRPGAA